MKIGIVGAGTLGRFLAETFCNDKHDVTVIDTSSKTLSRLRDKLDVMTLTGDAAHFKTLKEAMTEDFDIFIAVGSSDSVNLHTCRMARELGAGHIICRLASEKYFDTESGFTPDSMGIDHVAIPQEHCVDKVLDVLDNTATLDRITFSHGDALITDFRIEAKSPLNGIMLKDFPEPALIRSVRFAALVRNGELIAPRGDTLVREGDELYVAGCVKQVDAMIRWASPGTEEISLVIVAGDSTLAAGIAARVADKGFESRLIERDRANAERLLDDLNSKMMVINGDSSERDVLDEAGIQACDTFIAAGDDDESNILGCILAKRMGARKVVAVTNKVEYVDLVPRMNVLDTGFSRWLVAGNSILRYISTINRVHTSAILHRADACVSEFAVGEKSKVADKFIGECDFPDSCVLSMVFRGDEILTPAGDLKLLAGDIVAAVTSREVERKLGKLIS
ncbi:MAG: Trk system potassium transporter TrkA [Kiritimatiellaeota bacterium]|nr:Trk system potassium transporter TrkA [Kiritimatiellota bacterium]